MATFTCGLCGEEIHIEADKPNSVGRVLLAHRESCRSRSREREPRCDSATRAAALRESERHDPDKGR